MKKSVIELTKESMDKVILGAIEVISFSEIQKWDCYYEEHVRLYDGEDYLDDNGEPIIGHQVYKKLLFSPEVCEAGFEVYKEIYILPNGNFEIFHATRVGEYENEEGEDKDQIFWRTTRARSKEKSLSQTEVQDILFDLLTEVKKKEQ